MAYAIVGDLERRWRALAPSEKERAEQLLEDAAVLIHDAFPHRCDSGNFQLLEIVSCNMVRRAMEEPYGNAFGIPGQTVDTVAWGDSLPSEGVRLTREDRRMLRGGSRAMTVPIGV